MVSFIIASLCLMCAVEEQVTNLQDAFRDCVEPAPQGVRQGECPHCRRNMGQAILMPSGPAARVQMHLCVCARGRGAWFCCFCLDGRCLTPGHIGRCCCAGLPPLPRVLQPGRPDPQVRHEHLPPVLPRGTPVPQGQQAASLQKLGLSTSLACVVSQLPAARSIPWRLPSSAGVARRC